MQTVEVYNNDKAMRGAEVCVRGSEVKDLLAKVINDQKKKGPTYLYKHSMDRSTSTAPVAVTCPS